MIPENTIMKQRKFRQYTTVLEDSRASAELFWRARPKLQTVGSSYATFTTNITTATGTFISHHCRDNHNQAIYSLVNILWLMPMPYNTKQGYCGLPWIFRSSTTSWYSWEQPTTHTGPARHEAPMARTWAWLYGMRAATSVRYFYRLLYSCNKREKKSINKMVAI